MPLSPHSGSGGGESNGGSPDTRLTAPSPGDKVKRNAAKDDKISSNFPGSLCEDNQLVQFSSGERSEKEKDPFVTPGRALKSGLSPTASAFSPFYLGKPYTSQKETHLHVNTLSQDLGISRWLKFLGEETATPERVKEWLQEIELNKIIFYGAKRIIESNGSTGLLFDDVRDACMFHHQTTTLKRDWHVEYDMSPDYHLPQRNGQVTVLATLPRGFSTTAEQAENEVAAKLQVHGDIFALSKNITFSDGSFRAIVEYCDTTAAKLALSREQLSPKDCGIQVILTAAKNECTTANDINTSFHDAFPSAAGNSGSWEYIFASPKPDTMTLPNMTLNPPLTMYPVIPQSAYAANFPYLVNSFMASGPGAETVPLSTPISPSYQRVSAAYRKPPSPALTVHNGYSPSRSTTTYGKLERRHSAPRVNRNFQSPNSHHNHVDVHRIREGIDVRTTIMLRNIPNKVDQAMLKRIVDESSWGKYDFMYLRIDFANDCNVGYAFINFVDPLDIIDFVEARGNQRWNCFKSDKVAEVSYATIQGKDCLVQKFRNSSVMLEAAHYRPKLYFTSNGPMPDMAGQEESFPEPDNQSKMKRSCENAEHVGLFTPNAGQHFRDEQRRRRSQYDRGTRLAALEEYDLEAIQHLYIAGERAA